VHRVDRQPTRLDVGGTDDHSVDIGAPCGQFLGEHIGLEWKVAAKRRVAAADDDIGHMLGVGCLVQRIHHLAVEVRRVGLGKAASVGQDEEAGGRLLQRPLHVTDRPAG